MSRRLSHGEDGYTVDGRPLAFFHFSGFDPGSAERPQPPSDPSRPDEHPALRRILDEYAEALPAEGYASRARVAVHLRPLPDGTAIRSLAAPPSHAGRRGRGADRLAAPPTGLPRFLAWLGGQRPRRRRASTGCWRRLYGIAPDLRAGLPGRRRGASRRALPGLGAGRPAWPSCACRTPWRLPHVDAADGRREVRRPGRACAGNRCGGEVVGYFRSELGSARPRARWSARSTPAGVPLLPCTGGRSR